MNVRTSLGNLTNAEAMLEALVDPAALVDSKGVIRQVNESFVLKSEYPRTTFIGHKVSDFIPSFDPTVHKLIENRYLTLVTGTKNSLTVSLSLSPLILDGEEWFLAILRDNTERRNMELSLIDAERRFRLAFEDNMAPMLFIDLDDCAIDVNSAFCTLLGYSRDELLGHDSSVFTHPDDLDISEDVRERMLASNSPNIRYIKRYLHRNGTTVTVEVSRFPAVGDDGSPLYYVVSVRDITEELALNERLAFQALHDPLTGLANRTLFDERLAAAVARADRQNGLGAVLMIDLDDFRDVNNDYGHLVGDELLIQIARRLEEVTRSTDTLSRFGGDEFLYLADSINSPEQADQISARLLGAFSEPFYVQGIRIIQRASVGFTIWNASNTDQILVLRAADLALYEAKDLSKSQRALADHSA